MRRPWPTVVLLFTCAALLSSQIPPASFSGTVHDVSKKQITIETPEGNQLDFDINKKTQILRDKKAISSEDIQTGDVVTIDAREEFGKYLIAVRITVGRRAKAD